ncbi:MAG: hypothetical protein KF812_11155 [Fimbriimonadaceae bacterium]|nr:hypothetical protein [Fimbriimonadaceae bacterium]
MSKSISLFSGYSQKENRTTNYCLLILKLLYEENPKYLGEVLSAVLGEQVGDQVGVQFRQQEKRSKSVPDGLIAQSAFTVYIETKNFDWFNDSQIANHLEALNDEAPGLKILLALGNFESSDEGRFAEIHTLCTTTYQGKVVFAATGFENLLDALRELTLPKNLSDTVADFGAYLDEEGLLPNWQYRLDAVNCAGIVEEPIEGKVYLCPATGGAYNHKRSKFFGLYKWKRVSHVAVIKAVVDLDSPTTQRVLWKNVPGTDNEFIASAREKLGRWRPDRFPTRVFLLGDLAETEFWKDTKRGMQGSKQYFWVNAKDAEDLAEQLRGRGWSEWREG